MFLDIHVLQNVAYSCLNRDDTGSPKTAEYGGVTRTRVSSQAWKRPTRLFLDRVLAATDGADTVSRTVMYVENLREILTARGFDDDAADHAARVAFKTAATGFPKDKAKQGEDEDASADASGGKSRVLLFLSNSQYLDLADYIQANSTEIADQPSDKKDDKGFAVHRKAMERVLSEKRGLVRLFGRMIAHLPSANTDSAIQVAHALSVHAQIPETDYLTAVDDLKSADRSADLGAAGIFPGEFASSYLYRYATISLNTLHQNGLTSAEAAELAALTIEAFVLSLPTGKNSATAPHTRPDLVLVQVRDQQPLNLVGAFERPVRPGDGYAARSARALATHLGEIDQIYGRGRSYSGFVATGVADPDGGETLTPLGQRAVSLDELISAAREAMTA